MSKVHAGYTIIVRLTPGAEGFARALLQQYDADPTKLPFADMSTVHFASGAVLPKEHWGEHELPATLMIATSYCGPADEHVDELVKVGGAGLRALFAHCAERPDDDSDDALARFIVAHRRADTFYSGMHGISKQDVFDENRLRDEIETYLDAGPQPNDPVAVRKNIREHLAHNGFEWALKPLPPKPEPGVLSKLVAKVGLKQLGIAIGVLMFGISAAIALHGNPTACVVLSSIWLALFAPVLFLLTMIVAIRDSEEQQESVATRPPDAYARMVAATQNNIVINEMTVAGPIKTGNARPLFLRFALWAIATAGVGLIRTVATARWITIDGGRRLIFISNFTNAAEPYVRDFIDTKGGAMRINVSFGFGGEYPRTRWIVGAGAIEDSNGFIYVVTSKQSKTPFWYGPYKNLSIDNITLNRKIREGLVGDHHPDPQAWLHLL